MPLRAYIPVEKGPNGLGKIEVLPRLVKVTFMDGDDAGKTFEIDRMGCPETIRSGVFNVALNFEKDKMFDPLPPGGKDVTYIAAYAGMDHKENEPPMPQQDNGRAYDFTDSRTNMPVHKVEPPSKVFRVRWKILDGIYRGIVVPQTLRYLFQQWEDTDEAWVVTPIGEPWTTWGRQLMNTIKIGGFDQATDSIPYSPDGIGTLVALDRLFRDKRMVVTLHPGKKGWINRVSVGPEGTTIETYEPEVSSGKKKKTKTIEVEVDDDE